MEVIEIPPDAEFYLLPVIQTRPFNFLAFQRKTQRLDQMQKGSGGHTCSSDVARIPVNLRRYQNDVAFECAVYIISQIISHFCGSKLVSGFWSLAAGSDAAALDLSLGRK